MPNHNNYQYLFRVSHRSILPVAGISIPLFGSFKPLASYLVYDYETEGILNMISETKLLIGGASGRYTYILIALTQKEFPRVPRRESKLGSP
jgi:hypothetical protein